MHEHISTLLESAKTIKTVKNTLHISISNTYMPFINNIYMSLEMFEVLLWNCGIDFTLLKRY